MKKLNILKNKFKLLGFIFSIFLLGGFTLRIVGIDLTSFNPQTLFLQRLVSEFRKCEDESRGQVELLYSERSKCYSDTLVKMARNKGMEKTVSAFNEYRKSEEGSLIGLSECHILGHDAGYSALLDGQEPLSVFESCVNFCKKEGQRKEDYLLASSGCFNGAAHAYIASNRDLDEFGKVCRESGIPEEFVAYGCFHGIGHGIADVTYYDVPGGIEICNNFEGEEERYQCGHAVMMGPYHITISPIDSMPDDMYSFCSGLDEVYKETCFEYSGYLSYSGDLDMNKAMDTCGRIEEDVLRKRCTTILGRIFRFNTKNETETILEGCLSGRDGTMREKCLEGVLWQSVDVDSPDGTWGLTFCEQVPGGLKRHCYSYLGHAVSSRHNDEMRVRLCKKVPVEYRQVCLSSEREDFDEQEVFNAFF